MEQGSFKIERKRLADQIIEKLASMIAGGDLKLGEKLPSEPEL
jgi:DNA-binding FadR family transcriptional regulator